MQKLFICGVGGLVGQKLVNIAKEKYQIFGSYNLRDPKNNNIETYQLDIRESDKFKEIISHVKPDFLINATALNNVDYCENNKDEAFEVNCYAVSRLNDICSSNKCKLIHLSTDSVFDGTKKIPYNENDEPNPINNYGKSKLFGEQAVLKSKNNLIVRASVLYGWMPKSLVKIKTSSKKQENFAQWLILKLKSKEKVKIVSDEFSSPIIAEDFANSIIHLIKENHSGIFHSAPPIEISRYDFSLRLSNALKLESSLIEPVTIKEFGRDVNTAKNKCLDSSKLMKTNFKFLNLDQSFTILKEQISC